MKDLILVLVIWTSMMAFAFWKRRVNSRKSKMQLEEESVRRRMWWSSNSLAVLICKFMLFVGMLCVIANSILQGLDIRSRNARMRRFHGHVALYVVERKFDASVCRFRVELYNGSKSTIQVGRISPDKLSAEAIAIRANGNDNPIPLNESDFSSQCLTLAYDHSATINFSISTNLLPRCFSVSYRTTGGNPTNAVMTVHGNLAGEGQ